MRNMMPLLLLFCAVMNCAMAMPTAAAAVAAETNVPITLDSCIQLALRNNADMAVARLEIERAMEVKQQVFTKYFPQVQASFMAYHSLHHLLGVSPADLRSASKNQVGGFQIDLGDMLQMLLDSYNEQNGTNEKELGMMRHGWSVGGTVVQPIFMGGRVVNGNKLAQLGVEAAELQAEVTERDIIENIESSYYLVLGLQQKTATLESALSLLDSVEHTVKVAYEQGLVTKADVLQISLKRNEMQAQQLQLNSGIVLATKLLCLQTGLDYTPNLLLEDDLADDKMATRAAETTFVRPELQLLKLNVRAEKYQRKLTIGESLPQLAIGATYFYGDILTNGNLLQNSVYKHNGLLFATASIPLTAWWETAHKVRAHNLRIEEAEIQQRQLCGMMAIEEEKAFSDWQQAAALLKADSASLEMAEENYRLALLNYQSGLCTLTEVLQANTLLLQAQNAITDRQITLLEARRRYHDLTGK